MSIQEAYLPQSLISIVVPLLLVLLSALGGGRLLQLSVRGERWLGWGWSVTAVAYTDYLTRAEGAGFRMLAIIVVLLLAMKVVIAVEYRRLHGCKLTYHGWFAFALGWPGMKPELFESLGYGAQPENGYIRRGLLRFGFGVLLFAAARMVWPSEGVAGEPLQLLAATLLLLPAISFMLHFGLFNLLTGFWRRLGADANLLFDFPLQSTTLSEFWGRRWNLAFSEMTAAAVYRPLTRPLGRHWAMLAAFAFSGLLHELAISLPVRAGFGLPMLYFVLHGAAMFIERLLKKAGRPINRRPWVGRLWVLAWIMLPLPILFHQPFLRGIVWPLLSW